MAVNWASGTSATMGDNLPFGMGGSSSISKKKLEAFKQGRMNAARKKTPHELKKEREQKKAKVRSCAALRATHWDLVVGKYRCTVRGNGGHGGILTQHPQSDQISPAHIAPLH